MRFQCTTTFRGYLFPVLILTIATNSNTIAKIPQVSNELWGGQVFGLVELLIRQYGDGSTEATFRYLVAELSIIFQTYL